MTEEEIRPIAEDYVEEYCHCSDGEYTDGSLVCAGIGTALIVSGQLEKRIKELEKENAELKKKNLDTQDAVTMQMYTNKANKEMADRQLTKAKEIIKRLLATPRSIYGRGEDGELTSFFNSDYEDLEKQAEQFLKDCGVEK